MASMKTSPETAMQGVADIIPLLLGTAPFGLIFGVFAMEMGLGEAGGQGISLFVFAGSAQFVGSSLYGHGASLVIIFTTTFLINLRHALYGAALAPRLSGANSGQKIFMSFFLTDQAFAVVSKFQFIKSGYFWGAALAMYVNWQIWTLIGLIFNSQLREYIQLNLGFLMVPALIAIIVPQIKTKSSILCSLSAAFLSVMLSDLPHQSGLIISAVIAITVTILYEYFASNPGNPA